VAGCDGKLHAVDVNTGQALESLDIGGPADGMPAVANGRVYFCTAGGVFHAMSIKPLASLWKFGQKGDNEVIHAAAVNDQAVVLGTHDKTVVALDPATGEELWTFRLRAQAQSSPVIVGDLVLAATIRGRFHAIDLKTGKEVWQSDVGGRFIASPAVSNGRVVIGNDDGALYCFGAKQANRGPGN
jgi:outer membrane protein assembly factor BamB